MTIAETSGAADAASEPDEAPTPESRRSARERYQGKTAFVIMPFGTKTHPFSDEVIDFDRVYDELIRPALDQVLDRDNYHKSDESTDSGLIHSGMIDDIISSDLAIVDITTANPNVMYELGVRHAAKRSGTLVIKRSGDKIPFNINGMRAFEYPAADGPAERALFIETLVAAMKNALDGGAVDSLVHGLHRGLNVTRRARRLRRRETHVYRAPNGHWPQTNVPSRDIGVITGDIADVVDVDIWVNPENIAMQMGRYYDDSVSATIRYYGAKRDPRGFVRKDLISEKLAQAMARLPVVQPGTVISTTSGELKKRNGVRRVLHVAAQYGEPSKGYLTVRNAAGCVENCLRHVDHLNDRLMARLRKVVEYDSVIIPLFGTLNPDRIPEEAARDLVEAVRSYFEKAETSLIKSVFFLAYTDRDLSLCEQAFKSLGFTHLDTYASPRARDRRRAHGG